METKASLNQETIDKLQELIQMNIDSRDGFQEAAGQIEDPTIADFFRNLAAERTAQAEELKQLVAANAETPQQSGSLSAAAHRIWLDFRSALTGGDAYAVLAEAERGEDYIKDKYEEVIKETAGSAANDLFLKQYARVKASHDAVRDLRDLHKAR